MSNIGEVLKSLLKRKHLTQKELAKSLGISRTQIGNYISGYYMPSIKNALKLCEFFNCSIDFLLGHDVIPNRYGTYNSPSYEKFCQRYSDLLNENNTNHSRITREAQFNRNNLVYWNKRRTIPTLDILSKLSTILNVPIEYLIGRIDTKQE